MQKLLRWRVMSELTAHRFGWGVGLLVLLACTVLVMTMLHEFVFWQRIGLVICVAMAWAVLVSQWPKVLRR
jgi:hypothetical protein